MQWCLVEYLFDEVVDDEPVASGEGTYEGGDVRGLAHGERGQLKARDPAFGAGLEGCDVLSCERQACGVHEELGRFIGCEAQVGCAQFR